MEQKISETICYIAAHSGGHIIPCLTLAKKEKPKRILFFSSAKDLDQKIVTHSKVVDYYHTLPVTQKRTFFYVPILALGLIYSFLKSFLLLVWYHPIRIISTGSIIAIPACIAAWLLRIPIELFEVNATPGKTIIFLSRFASRIHVCFLQTMRYFPKKNCTVTPYPIRFSKPITPISLANFKSDRLTIFVQGGSQGSHGINILIKSVIKMYPTLQNSVQIIHQTGDDPKEWQKFYSTLHIPAHVFGYEDALASYYSAADLIICRSGAGALFESLHFKKRCITIPLQAATTSHQLENAKAIVAQYPRYFQLIVQDENCFNRLSQSLFSNITIITA